MAKLPSSFGIFRKIVSKRVDALARYYSYTIAWAEFEIGKELCQRWNNDWRRQFGVGGRFASRANRRRGGKGREGANEWVIVEPGQALAAAGQERKTLLAHISSSPSLSFSRRSFIFIPSPFILVVPPFLPFRPFFSAPSHHPIPYPYRCREPDVFRRWWHHPLRFICGPRTSAALTIGVYVSRREDPRRSDNFSLLCSNSKYTYRHFEISSGFQDLFSASKR